MRALLSLGLALSGCTLLVGNRVARCNNGEPEPAELCYGARASLLVGGVPADLVAADLDQDGAPDLVAALHGEGRLAVLRNQGGGVFRDQGPDLLLTVGANPRALVAVDLDQDSDPDLLSADQGAGALSLATNDGGAFSVRSISLGGSPAALVAADLDQDGALDLVAALDEGFLAFLPGGVDGPGEPQLVAIDGRATSLAVLDTPAGPLLFAADFERGALLRFSHRAGALQPEAAVTLGGGPFALQVGDLDNDDTPDLVLLRTGGDVLLLDADLNTRGAVTVLGNPAALALGDLDQDGALDLFVPDALLGSASLLRNRGDFSFETSLVFTELAPLAALARDLSGDGVPELVVANSGAASLSYLLARP